MPCTSPKPLAHQSPREVPAHPRRTLDTVESPLSPPVRPGSYVPLTGPFRGSGGFRARLHLPTPFLVAIQDRLPRLLHVIGDDQALEVIGRDLALAEYRPLDPIQQPLPIRAAEQDHWEILNLPRLDQGQRLEQLVQRAEAARKDDERLRVLDEHR